jgi:HK97 gp10 family phage protein
VADVSVDNSEFRVMAAQMRTAHGRVGADGAKIVRAFTLRVEARAKVYCPVDTGYLKNSIGSEFEGSGRSGEMTGTVTAGASYARYVESGTSRMHAQPFMNPAADAEEPGYLEACAQLAARCAAGGDA